MDDVSGAILFLDVDGVLNRPGTTERSPHGTYGVEPDKAAMVRRILDQSGAKIVVCSTWRAYPDLMGYLWRKLDLHPRNRHYRVTTPPGGPTRGDEIQRWLDQYTGVTRFVILDDDSDMGHLLPYLVQTDPREGLTDEIADDAIARLTGTPEEPEK